MLSRRTALCDRQPVLPHFQGASSRDPGWSPFDALGARCMAAIRPFRHLIVYPPITRQIERE